jgi:hypothetical protein
MDTAPVVITGFETLSALSIAVATIVKPPEVTTALPIASALAIPVGDMVEAAATLAE